MSTIPEYVPLVATQIAAAAILQEAGRLAGNGSTQTKNITPENIQQAVKGYQKILEAIREQEE